jgi:hypothetical protein
MHPGSDVKLASGPLITKGHDMYSAIKHTIAMLAMTSTLAANTANAQTTANGPYYATPSWDQTLPANTRFVVLSNFNNQAVLDRETGLVWQRSPSLTFVAWSAISAACVNSAIGGRYGWRLPTVHELASLLDPAATTTPALPSGHPFNNLNFFDTFWTATQQEDSPPNSAVVGWNQPAFSPSAPVTIIFTYGSRTASVSRGWCVRGALQAAPQ